MVWEVICGNENNCSIFLYTKLFYSGNLNTKKEVEKALEHVSVENASVEEIIRKCLSILGK